jgi:hypothetical protein
MPGCWKNATTVSLAALLASSAEASDPKVAVFNFELVDTSLEGATYGPRHDQQERLARAGDQLRDRLAKSGRSKWSILPQSPRRRPRSTYGLQRLRREVCVRTRRGLFDRRLVPESFKSDSQHEHRMRDARSGRMFAVKSVDMRGNTDETWSRALDWLVRYDLLKPRGIF